MEKDIFTIIENTLSYGRGYVYSLQYHLVWCTKYRKQVLKNGLDAECKKCYMNLQRNTDFRFLRWRLCRIIFIYFWTVSHSFLYQI